MDSRVINPWKWQDQFGFVQAHEAAGFSRIVVCAGQAAINAEGAPMHAGDMGAQITLALDNLESVL
jgi:enamine deaminase RidA (YjgF/YER057c/UK114 family)